MSGTDIHNKQQSPWPWLLGFVILAGFVWIILNFIYLPDSDGNAVLVGNKSYTKERYEIPADSLNEVRDFIEYVNDTTQNLPPKRYTEQGLIKLQSALSYIADHTDSEKAAVQDEINLLDRTIVRIDTSSHNYLRLVKPALSAAVKTIVSIEKSRTSVRSRGTIDLNRIESGIDTSRSFKSQFGKIKQFFTAAGMALQQMKSSNQYSFDKSSL